VLLIAALVVVATVLAWRWLQQQSVVPSQSVAPPAPAPAAAPPQPAKPGEDLSNEERRALEGVLKRKGGGAEK
jgi:hypothetical protein